MYFVMSLSIIVICIGILLISKYLKCKNINLSSSFKIILIMMGTITCMIWAFERLYIDDFAILSILFNSMIIVVYLPSIIICFLTFRFLKDKENDPKIYRIILIVLGIVAGIIWTIGSIPFAEMTWVCFFVIMLVIIIGGVLGYISSLRKTKNNNQLYFSLLIIFILSNTLISNLPAYVPNNAKINATKGSLHYIRKAIEKYKNEHDMNNPPTLDHLIPKYVDINKVPKKLHGWKDHWKTPFIYNPLEKDLYKMIYSAGPDKRFGTQDDIYLKFEKDDE